MALTQASYSQAEVLCLPNKGDTHRSQLMWTRNARHWDHVSKLVKEKTSFDYFWAGISDRDADSFFMSSFGDNITSTDEIFNDPSTVAPGTCGVATNGLAGYLRAGYCEEKKAYVCSRESLTVPPNYDCPNEYIRYRDMCLFPDIRPMTYEVATVSFQSL